MQKRWLLLVAVLVLICGLILLPRDDDKDGPPEPDVSAPDSSQGPNPPVVPPLESTDAGEPVVAPEPGSDAHAEGLCIAGQVLNANGERSGKAWLEIVRVNESDDGEISEVRDETDDRGRFRIRGLAPGQYQLRALTPDHAESGDVVAFAGDERVVIRLERRAILTVKIAADPGGPERTRNTLTFCHLFDESGEEIANCRIVGFDGDGLKCAVAPGRTYRVDAGRDGYRQVGTGEVFVPPGTREMEFTVRLEPPPESDQAKVAFRIRDERGDPVKRIFIEGRMSPSEFMGDIYEPGSGVIEFSLSAGSWKFSFYRVPRAGRLKAPYLRKDLEFVLSPGERATRDVTLKCGGWIRFHLPEDCAEGSIVCGPATGGLREIETNPAPDGDGFFPDVEGPFVPGEYVAYLRVADRVPVKTEFVVRPFDETDVRLNPPKIR